MIETVARYAGYLSGIVAALTLFVKPVREWLFGKKVEREVLRCLLRTQMLDIYYKYKDTGKIRQYDMENFVLLYKAYKSMKGNSFVDEINVKVRQWEVIT